MKPQHAHHILQQFTSEYYGDPQACSMLFIEYQQAQLDATVADLEANNSSAESANLFDQSLFKTEEAQQFQFWLVRYCKHAFLNCMNGYNNYSQPLIVPQDIMNYLPLSKHIFPQQWAFLSAVRGITSRDSDNLKEYKEQQVFLVILNLQRMANYKPLKHWVMIMATMYYGWGAKDTVGNVMSFIGITVNRKTRDEFYKSPTIDQV
jgi:hypothetical protein